jgi:AraC family transcriptional regulator
MIPSTASVGLIAVIAPGILLERHTFSDLEVSRHLHPTHCLHLQTAGVSRVHWFADGKSGTETMSASSLMLHGQGTWDSMAFTGESSRIVVSLDPASIANMLQDESGRLLFQTPSRWHFLDRQVERLMRNLEAEAENGFQTGRTYAQLIGLSLCEYLMRRYSGAHLSPPTCKGGLPKRRLDRVLEYIAANLSQSLSLTEIAEIAGMSPYHFARLFKTSTGLSPHQFVLAQRIERAKHLLRGGKSSVIDVALQSGFDGQSHFSKMFRKATGLSPIRFRNHLQ